MTEVESFLKKSTIFSRLIARVFLATTILALCLAGCEHKARPAADRAPCGLAVSEIRQCPNEQCVIECTDYGKKRKYGNSAPDRRVYCFGLLTAAKKYARPISEAELQSQIAQLSKWKVRERPGPYTFAELREQLIKAMNIGFLINEIDSRPLKVTTTGVSGAAGYEEDTLLFDDPFIGEFEAILRTPATPGPHPMIIAVHGHDESPQRYADAYSKEFLARGYAVLMPTMPALAAMCPEHEVTREFLLDGFTYLGVQCYEVLLALKYARHLAGNAPVGLIGKSGGSAVCNVVARLDDRFGAFVSDYQTDYFDLNESGQYVHTLAPALYPYHIRINDFASSNMPALAVPHGYVELGTAVSYLPRILAFFDRHLKR